MARLVRAMVWVGVAALACVSRNNDVYVEAASSLWPEKLSGPHCRDSRDCGTRLYCSRPGCDGKGRCALMSGIQNDVFQPVCACNGLTYGNDDAAHWDGQSISHLLVRGEASGRQCEPHFVCRDHEPVEGVDCSSEGSAAPQQASKP